MDQSGLTTDEAGRMYCAWRTAAPAYLHYHDHEWGVPVADDIALYEKICLEGFQAGMAWITILRKRENFRQAFEGFDFRRVAHYGEADIERMLTPVYDALRDAVDRARTELENKLTQK